MDLVRKPLGIKLWRMTQIETFTNSHSIGSHTLKNTYISCRKCPLLLNNKGHRKCVTQLSDSCRLCLIGLDECCCECLFRWNDEVVYDSAGYGVCMFILWCKVDVLMLNPVDEIFTHWMVGRELRQFI